MRESERLEEREKWRRRCQRGGGEEGEGKVYKKKIKDKVGPGTRQTNGREGKGRRKKVESNQVMCIQYILIISIMTKEA